MAAKGTEWRPGPSVCRCCFAEGCYKDISTEYFWMGKREVYSEMLTTTFDISIAYSQSGGPNSNSRLICEPCISRLRDAADFKRQVQECERVFLQHLDPVPSRELEVTVQITPESPEKEVKLERVKVERKLSDDDFEPTSFPDDDDDDDDDMDDEPLTKLASKVPKKESVDLMDLLDNAKAEKRKSTTKVKATPAKKVKKKEAPKPSASNAPPKTEKKKKECEAKIIARRNAEIILKYTTAYPFRLPEETMVCVYCCESFDDPAAYRIHMDTDHKTFRIRTAFHHITEGYVKVDCTTLRCRICCTKLENFESAAKHLSDEHEKSINFEFDFGLQPFVMYKDKYFCCFCNWKAISIRQLSRHTQSHFLKYTCENCGKSYSTNTSLNHHIKYSHSGGEKICRKCRKTFSSLEEKRAHMNSSRKCWPHVCSFCNERFFSWNSKQQHLIEVHNKPKKEFPCPECPEVFSDRKKYRSHFKLAHTDDNYICSCCGMKFDRQRGLEEHIVVHTKEKLFPCPVCSKSFGRKKNLAQHMWIHNEYKRFSCCICEKVFNQRVSWKTHMRSHHPDVEVDFDEGKNNNHKNHSVYSV